MTTGDRLAGGRGGGGSPPLPVGGTAADPIEWDAPEATSTDQMCDARAAAAVQARRLRDLRETTTRLGEEVGRLNADLREVTEQLRRTSGRHADLAAAVSEDIALRVGALQQALTDGLAELRGDVDVLLSEREERDKSRNPPVDWMSLTEEQAAAQWPVLARWVGEVLVPGYEVTRDALPDCWPLHGPVVAELSWLRTAYVQAHLPRSQPALAADWHTRWRPAALARIRELISSEECAPGTHRPRRGTAMDVPRQAGGGTPRQELAGPRCWWPFYARAYVDDLAARRDRAAAVELNWSPVRTRA